MCNILAASTLILLFVQMFKKYLSQGAKILLRKIENLLEYQETFYLQHGISKIN